MELCGGRFRPDCDHSLATFEGEKFLGGFVACEYMGNAIAIHDGAVDPRWCSRDLLWMLFHYVFRQLGCHKAYAPTPSDNFHALELNLRAGWRWGHVLENALAPGRHLVLLEMEPSYCKWLRIMPKQYKFGT